MRDPSYWGVTVADLIRARKEAQHAAYEAEPCNYVVLEDAAACRAALRLLPSPQPVALDIETSGKRITCIGLCQTPPHVYVLPGDLALTRESGFPTWAKSAHLLIHNAAFDVPALRANGIEVGRWDDTMLLHHSVYSELPQTLAFVQSVYTRLPFHKGMMKFEKEEEK